MAVTVNLKLGRVLIQVHAEIFGEVVSLLVKHRETLRFVANLAPNNSVGNTTMATDIYEILLASCVDAKIVLRKGEVEVHYKDGLATPRNRFGLSKSILADKEIRKTRTVKTVDIKCNPESGVSYARQLRQDLTREARFISVAELSVLIHRLIVNDDR